MSANQRIQTLDSFRFISITLVIFFHYLSRWTGPIFDDNYYPYGSTFAEVPILMNGDLGVPFFFIISGFVIIFTLERTKSIKDFLLRRFIRLWPTMLLCAVMTFVFIRVTDAVVDFPEFDAGIKSFLPSLTFTRPSLWDVQYIDGVYWSLEIEVKFYVFSSIVYFISKKYFAFVWTFICATALGSYLLFHSMLDTHPVFDYIFYPRYLQFFASGVLFYELFKNSKAVYIWPSIVIFFLYSFYVKNSTEERIFISVYYLLFILFIYKNEWLEWMNRKWVLAIGVASYPLYLLHQHIGVVIISKVYKVLPLPINAQILYPILVFALMCAASYMIYLKFEMPVKKMLMKLFYPKKIISS